MRFHRAQFTPSRLQQHGVTLIELLIVLSVLAVICAIVFPSFTYSRQVAVMASRSAELTSLFQLTQSRAINQSQAYRLVWHQDENTQCIIAQPVNEKANSVSRTDAMAKISCQQTTLAMVRLPKAIQLKKKVSEGWVLLPDGDLFTIDFRTQRPSHNLTLGLSRDLASTPDYIVTVRQYLGFDVCPWREVASACS